MIYITHHIQSVISIRESCNTTVPKGDSLVYIMNSRRKIRNVDGCNAFYAFANKSFNATETS